MNLELAGKVGIVTGAGSGIGETIALEFGKEKTKVVICDIDLAAAQKVRDRIEGTGSDVLVAKTDVSKQADVNKMVEKTLEEFGKIDILVNNAGVTKGVGFLGMDEADWDRLFNVNVKGMFYCCRAVLPHMIRQQSGKIINISSQQGKRGVANLTGYCGTKFAAVGITQSLADEMAEYNINVNAEEAGLDLDNGRFRQALQDILVAEGVPVGAYQIRPIPGQTIFQEKKGYGKGCPWTCPHARKVEYDMQDYPETLRTIEESLRFPPQHYPPLSSSLLLPQCNAQLRGSSRSQ